MPVLVCALILVASCDGGLDPLWIDLQVGIPSIPESWRGMNRIEFRLRWRDVDGREQVGPWVTGGSLWLRLPRGRLCPVLLEARAYFGSDRRPFGVRPAGILYPPGAESASGDTQPGWVGGYACVIAWILEREGLGAADYDLVRLAQRAASGGDPWRLEPATAAQALHEGRFRASMMEGNDALDVVLPAGTWFSESPFVPITLDPERHVPVARLWPGIHRFGGAGGQISVEVASDGSTIWAGDLVASPE